MTVAVLAQGPWRGGGGGLTRVLVEQNSVGVEGWHTQESMYNLMHNRLTNL